MSDAKTKCLKHTRKTIIEYLDGVWDGGKDGWDAVVQHIDEVLNDGGCVHTRVVTVLGDQLEELNKILESETGIVGEPEVIQVFTATFDNGIEADIKVVNGCEDSGPYVDPVLFQFGNEVAVIEATDQLDGEYIFWYDSNKYIVLVRGEE